MGLRSTKVGAFPCECSADAPDGHQHEPSCPVYVSEIDDLRAAAERLRKDVEELTHILDSHRVTYPDKLGHWSCEPEIERLTLADRQWADHFKRLAEENERLRAALNRHHVPGFGCAICGGGPREP